MPHTKSVAVAAFALIAGCASSASAMSELIFFSGPDGLAAEAEFTMIDPNTLEIRLKNTSTGVPAGFGSSDQILTGISFDFDMPGANISDPAILGGTAIIGPTSQSVNFDTGSYGPGTSIGGEWGYGNTGGTGAFLNVVSGNGSQTTAFGGPDLDGPGVLDGPQGGLISSAFSLPLGGNGAIMDEIIITLDVAPPMTDLSFLLANGVTVEFGSDAAFITVPTPASAALLGAGCLLTRRRRA